MTFALQRVSLISSLFALFSFSLLAEGNFFPVAMKIISLWLLFFRCTLTSFSIVVPFLITHHITWNRIECIYVDSTKKKSIHFDCWMMMMTCESENCHLIHSRSWQITHICMKKTKRNSQFFKMNFFFWEKWKLNKIFPHHSLIQSSRWFCFVVLLNFAARSVKNRKSRIKGFSEDFGYNLMKLIFFSYALIIKL